MQTIVLLAFDKVEADTLNTSLDQVLCNKGLSIKYSHIFRTTFMCYSIGCTPLYLRGKQSILTHYEVIALHQTPMSNLAYSMPLNYKFHGQNLIACARMVSDP